MRRSVNILLQFHKRMAMPAISTVYMAAMAATLGSESDRKSGMALCE